MTSRRTRERLIQRLKEAGIRDPEVLAVMCRLPRHLFVDEVLASRAYEESALPIGHGQTISQLYTVARMTEALLAQGNPDTVLEIGTGSGYQTAVLASLVAPGLQRRARGAPAGEGPAYFEKAQAAECAPAPRRRCLGLAGVCALRYHLGHRRAGRDSPRARQPADHGGCMVLPIGHSEQQVLVRVLRTETGYVHEILEPVTFVPLLGGMT